MLGGREKWQSPANGGVWYTSLVRSRGRKNVVWSNKRHLQSNGYTTVYSRLCGEETYLQSFHLSDDFVTLIVAALRHKHIHFCKLCRPLCIITQDLHITSQMLMCWPLCNSFIGITSYHYHIITSQLHHYDITYHYYVAITSYIIVLLHHYYIITYQCRSLLHHHIVSLLHHYYIPFIYITPVLCHHSLLR